MKRLLLLLPLLLLLCGCRSARETSLLSPVSALAVQTGTAGVRLTVETAWQSSSDGSATPQYLTARAATVGDSFAAVAAGVGSDLYFSHAQVMIVDETTARQGLLPLCDYLSSNSEMRLGLRLVVARGVPASKIIHAWAPNGDIPGNALARILAQGKIRHNAIDMPFFRFYNDLLGGGEALLPAVTLTKDGRAVPDGTAVFAGGRLSGFRGGGAANG